MYEQVMHDSTATENRLMGLNYSDGMLKSIKVYREIPFIQDWIDIKDFILMQYTGLKDKNGKEIYEGDLVKINNLTEKWKYGEPEFDWRVFVVEYNVYTWAFNNSYLYMPLSTYKDSGGEFYDYDLEVIGNIHDNPDLLINNK